ncbi:hypothetical protein CANMA_002422 [Candida margitis]|uniref:uncharacterized protein n=1 Tax=Candida margitis TaxID=1775924 RepID=UPI0022272326|nr:uncharacterized protein CANMA_002422 [Candida margitis]KAI5968206.1 hypothetical protein CANMA_002422 [Candida margitis]
MGLVSIWASEETGGEKPNDKKPGVSKGGEHTLESKWSKPITSTSKLESQWGSSSSDSKEGDTYSRNDREDKGSNNHENSRPRFNKRGGHKTHGAKSHQDKELHRRHSKSRDTVYSGDQRHRYHDTHEAPVEAYEKDSDEETVVADKLYPKGPMTKSARSLAARITIEPKREDNDDDDNPTVWGEASEDDGEKGERSKPKPAQGRSLAARLDGLNFKETEDKPSDSERIKERRKRLDKEPRKQSIGRQTRRNKDTKPSAVKVDPIDKQAAIEKEEKEKQDFLKMLEEFESKKLDWASFEE